MNTKICTYIGTLNVNMLGTFKCFQIRESSFFQTYSYCIRTQKGFCDKTFLHFRESSSVIKGWMFWGISASERDRLCRCDIVTKIITYIQCLQFNSYMKIVKFEATFHGHDVRVKTYHICYWVCTSSLFNTYGVYYIIWIYIDTMLMLC